MPWADKDKLWKFAERDYLVVWTGYEGLANYCKRVLPIMEEGDIHGYDMKWHVCDRIQYLADLWKGDEPTFSALKDNPPPYDAEMALDYVFKKLKELQILRGKALKYEQIKKAKARKIRVETEGDGGY